MIEFILIACLGGDLSECRTEKRLWVDMTLFQCMTSAQFLAADWAIDHPDWQVQRHFCRMFRSSRADA